MDSQRGMGGRVGLGKISLGFILSAAILAGGAFFYLKYGSLPVAVADSPLPFEKRIVRIATRARIARQMQSVPFGTTEAALESGAHIYKDHCLVCHGRPGHDSPYARRMFPPPPQMWKKHGTNGAAGVSEFEPGMIYWFVANGVRLSGMPSFTHALSETQMWQVSLLLKNADKAPLPQVSQILNLPDL